MSGIFWITIISSVIILSVILIVVIIILENNKNDHNNEHHHHSKRNFNILNAILWTIIILISILLVFSVIWLLYLFYIRCKNGRSVITCGITKNKYAIDECVVVEEECVGNDDDVGPLLLFEGREERCRDDESMSMRRSNSTIITRPRQNCRMFYGCDSDYKIKGKIEN